jgi:hypothetical protein
MSVYVEMSCVGSGLATGRSPAQENQLSKRFIISEVILNGEQARQSNASRQNKNKRLITNSLLQY